MVWRVLGTYSMFSVEAAAFTLMLSVKQVSILKPSDSVDVWVYV